MAGCCKVDWAKMQQNKILKKNTKTTPKFKNSNLQHQFYFPALIPTHLANASSAVCWHLPASPFVTLCTLLACVAAASPPLPPPSCPSHFHHHVPSPLLPIMTVLLLLCPYLFMFVTLPPLWAPLHHDCPCTLLTGVASALSHFTEWKKTLRWLFHASLSCLVFRYFHLLCGSKGKCILEAKAGKMCRKVDFPYLFLCWYPGNMGEKLSYRSSSSVVESFPCFLLFVLNSVPHGQ